MHYWLDVVNKGIWCKSLVLSYYTLFWNCWLDTINKGTWYKTLVLSYYTLSWNCWLAVNNKGIWHKSLVLSYHALFWNCWLDVINKGIWHKSLVLSYYRGILPDLMNIFRYSIIEEFLAFKPKIQDLSDFLTFMTFLFKITYERQFLLLECWGGVVIKINDLLKIQLHNSISVIYGSVKEGLKREISLLIPLFRKFMVICGVALIITCKECLSILGSDEGGIGGRQMNGTLLMSCKQSILEGNIVYLCPHFKHGICSLANKGIWQKNP